MTSSVGAASEDPPICPALSFSEPGACDERTQDWVRTSLPSGFPYSNVDALFTSEAVVKSDSCERLLPRFVTAASEAVLLTRKWDFQEGEAGSENEVTC